MKSYPECLSCIFRQAIRTAKIASADPRDWEQIIRFLADRIPHMDLEKDTPADVSEHVYEIVAKVTGNADPYKTLKLETNKQAKNLLPKLEELVFTSDDPLRNAVHVAVAGNIIDFGIMHDLKLEEDVLPIANQTFAIDDLPLFRKDIEKGKTLLYIGDNSGEIIFDRVLIEELIELGMEVTFVVKSAPIINDVTVSDADYAGISDIAKVIETGSGNLGVNWKHTSKEFKTAFSSADIIISKGHANFETLSECEGNIYFLLKTKCECVARELGVNLGDIIFKHTSIKDIDNLPNGRW